MNYLLTSDKLFLINIDKIVAIQLNAPAKTFEIQNNVDVTDEELNAFKLSTFIVYMEGFDTPIKLKYRDGVRLINLISENHSINYVDTTSLDNENKLKETFIEKTNPASWNNIDFDELANMPYKLNYVGEIKQNEETSTGEVSGSITGGDVEEGNLTGKA